MNNAIILSNIIYYLIINIKFLIKINCKKINIDIKIYNYFYKLYILKFIICKNHIIYLIIIIYL